MSNEVKSVEQEATTLANSVGQAKTINELYNKLKSIATVNATKERKNLSAIEARNLALTSNASKNEVYKQIKAAASENQISVIHSFYGCAPLVVESIVADLDEQGYQVCYVDENGDDAAHYVLAETESIVPIVTIKIK